MPMQHKPFMQQSQQNIPEAQVFHHGFSAQHHPDLHDQHMSLQVSQFPDHLAGPNIFSVVNW